MEPSPTPVPNQKTDAVRVAIVVGYGLALVPVILGLFDSSYFAWWRPVPRMVAVCVLIATPPTLAVLTDRHRPAMLLVAGVTGVLAPFVGLSVIFFPFLILGAIWLAGYAKGAPEFRMRVLLAVVLTPLLWAGAGPALWVHSDPVCEQRMRDGTVIQLDPADYGLESGWSWAVSAGGPMSSGELGPEVVGWHCTSDTVTALEAAIAVVLCGLSIASALALTRTTPELTTTAVSYP